MKRILLRVLVAATVTVVGMAAAETKPRTGPQQNPTFHARVDLVRIDVAVERKGQPVTGLSMADFEVLDNGVRQTLDGVLTEAVPLDAWLVLDVSGGLQGRPMVQLQNAASAFVSALASGDRAALVTFSHEVLVPQPLTPDLHAVQAAITRMQAHGATALYDATYVALQLRNPGETRGIGVVLTDGVDNASWLSAERVVEAAEHHDVTLYGIAVNEAAPASRLPQTLASDSPAPSPTAPLATAVADLPRYRFLRALAAATGGRLFDASFGDLGRVLANVLRDVRARYLLTYYPVNPAPGWHTLQVKLTQARADITARRGYWVAAEK